MDFTIRGPFAIAAAKLQRMVAYSPEFQSSRGVSNVDDAIAFVFLREAIGDTQRPYAVISLGQGDEYNLDSGGAQNNLRPKGGVYLYLTMDTPPEFYADQVQAEFAAASFFGAVVDDVANLAGADDIGSPWGESHLPIISITRPNFGENPENTWQSLGRFYTAVYSVSWAA